MSQQQGNGGDPQKPHLQLSVPSHHALRLSIPSSHGSRPHPSLILPSLRSTSISAQIQEASLIGHAIDTAQTPWHNTTSPIWLSDAARSRSLYLLGKTGTGKTTVFLNLLLQDIARRIGVCFVDPVGDAINDLIARIPENRLDDVILLDVLHPDYCFGLNLYACSSPGDRVIFRTSVERVMHLCRLLWGDRERNYELGVRVEEYLSNSAHTLIANPGATLADIPALFKNEQAREQLTRQVTNQMVLDFWDEYNELGRVHPREQLERRSVALNKVNRFLENDLVLHIVGQAHTTIPFRQIMDDPSGKILLIRLSNTHQELSRLVGAMVIAQLLEAAKSRIDIPNKADRRQFNLYSDEYHLFATADWGELIEQARKFNVCVGGFGHQRMSQLPYDSRQAALGTRNKIILGVSYTDGEEIAGELDCTPLPPPIIGYDTKPRYVPSEQVVYDLKKGHANPRITALFNEWIRQLHEEKQVLIVGKNIVERPYDMQLNLINRFLADAQTGRAVIASPEQLELLCEIVFSVLEKFGTYTHHYSSSYAGVVAGVYPTQEDTDTTLRAFVHSFTHGFFPPHAYQAFFRERLHFWLKYLFIEAHAVWQPLGETAKTAEELWRYRRYLKQQELDDERLKKIEMLSAPIAHYHRLRTDDVYRSEYKFSPPSAQSVASTMLETLNSLEQEGLVAGTPALIAQLRHYLAVWQTEEFQKNLALLQTDRDGAPLLELATQLVSYHAQQYMQLCDQRAAADYAEGLDIAYRSGDPVMRERFQKAYQSAYHDVYETDNVPQFVRDMMELAELLHLWPVWTPSGQLDLTPRFGAQQTYADRKQELANMLRGLPDLVARCVVLEAGTPQEYTVSIPLPQPGCAPDALQQRIHLIEENTLHAGYYRLRAEVAQEIASRYEQWHQASATQPPPRRGASQPASHPSPPPRRGN